MVHLFKIQMEMHETEKVKFVLFVFSGGNSRSRGLPVSRVADIHVMISDDDSYKASDF